MGNQSSARSLDKGSSGEFTEVLSRDAPLIFHKTHSENVQLFNNKRRAKRIESFCKGIAFSARPVQVGERIYMKFAETSTSWSGVLRFGLTSRDPTTIQSSTLPRYACPDLTNKPGFWAKALGERYADSGVILYFYVTRSGDVIFGVNGEEKGLFFSGVNTSSPLWALIDIYGNTIAMEFLDARQAGMATQETETLSSSVSVGLPASMANLQLRAQSKDNHVIPLKYHANVLFTPMAFNRVKGRNVNLSGQDYIATRELEEYCNAYVFTERPLKCGQKVVIQVLGTERAYVGGLAFGLTACDPSTLGPDDLPDDSDSLLDRPEYWVVNKDVCTSSERGDELSFTLTNEGEVHFGKNGHHVTVLMHVDKTLPLWPFFDVYGNTQKIKILGLAGLRIPKHSVQGIPQREAARRRELHVTLPPPPRASRDPLVNREQVPAVPPRTLTPLRSNSVPGSMVSTPITPPPLEPRPGTCSGRSLGNVSSSPKPINLPPPLLPLPDTPRQTPGPGESNLTNSPGNDSPDSTNTSKAQNDSTNTSKAQNVSENNTGSIISIPRSGNSLFQIQTPTAETTQSLGIIGEGNTMFTSIDVDNAKNDFTDHDVNECTVCYERQVDCVLYTCGHMCMCYECAIDVKNERGALCPICRKEIKDIIRTYRS